MYVFYKPEEFPVPSEPITLTIGNFDGVHLGHREILQCMQTLSAPNTHSCVITFSNHPSEILKPTQTTALICTLSHKINLLKEAGINNLLLLTFNAEFAQQTAEDFIQKIRSFIPFSHLILGHDATLGNNRQGDKSMMKQLAAQLNFEVHYIKEYCHGGGIVSSSSVRRLLQEGNLNGVEQLLGRPYSVYSTIQPGLSKGRHIGFPTANLSVSNLCLPPYGVYAVTLKFGGISFPGIANLGLAPTIKNTNSPLLEVHIFSFSEDLYGKEVEVIFHKFIRPEKKFSSIEELKIQIQSDIAHIRCNH